VYVLFSDTNENTTYFYPSPENGWRQERMTMMMMMMMMMTAPELD